MHLKEVNSSLNFKIFTCCTELISALIKLRLLGRHGERGEMATKNLRRKSRICRIVFGGYIESCNVLIA